MHNIQNIEEGGIFTSLKLLCLVFFGFVLYSSCGSNEVPDIETKETVIVYDELAYAEALQAELTYLQEDSGFYYLAWMDTLIDFYAARNFEPVWAATCTDSTGFMKWNQFIEKAAIEEGLYAKWYDLPRINDLRMDILEKNQWNYNQLAAMDIQMSLCLLHIHKDHIVGRTNPKEVFGGNYQLPQRDHSEFDWMSVLSQKEYQTRFAAQSIQDSFYLGLKSELMKYQKLLSDSVVWEQVDFKDLKKLEPGDATELMPAIAAKLIQMGLINHTVLTSKDSVEYTKSFSKQIKAVQSAYSMTNDGIIGGQSMKLINTSLGDRIAEIMANMERVRWFYEDPQEKKVLVNLPDYTLNMASADSSKSMVVCVGKAKAANYLEQWKKYQESKRWYHKPKNHETPQIYSRIRYMVLNPTWTVPKSIIMREMYWRMLRDSSYLRRNKYRVYQGKNELYPDTINWRKYRANRLPFKIVQVEGEGNALGRVKYIFPNPFSIYLHDTPLKSKFKVKQRAVSHGCVRLAEPFEMARFLLEDNPRVNYDDFRIKMGLMPLDSIRLIEYDPLDTLAKIQPIDSTEVIYLHKPIPVYFVYRTLYFSEGNPIYRYDIYHKNSAIIEAMGWAEIKEL